MESFGEWLGRELERSSDFAREIERLRAEATRSRKATKPLSEYRSIDEMRSDLDRARDTPSHSRPFAWRSDDHMWKTNTEEPCEPLVHVERYSRRVQTRAYYLTGASANADALLP